MRIPDDISRRVLSRRTILKAGVGGVGASLVPHAAKVRARPGSGRLVRRKDGSVAEVNAAELRALDERETSLQQASLSAPILILTDASASPYGTYVRELLNTEGVKGHETRSLSELSSSLLDGRSVVVLGAAEPSSSQITLLEEFVQSGGGLVALRPASGLDTLLGVTRLTGSVSDGYIRITSADVGGGLFSGTMQYHGLSRRYALNGAVEIAELYLNRDSTAGVPAATMHTFGLGRAAMFSFDLAESIALIRQGNPANADTDTDGDGIVRSIDIFVGWVDLQRTHVPQADMQQRLLVRLIEAAGQQPVPRLWYFPDTAPTVLVATGDAHANPKSYYQAMIDAFSQRNMAMTFYITTSGPSPSTLASWMNQGFDFAPHPYVDSGYQSGYQVSFNDFINDYGFQPRSARTHQVRWTGWSEGAAIKTAVGVEMDFDTYQWGAWLNTPNGPARGYTCGSGLPMRFVNPDGSLVQSYQQHTNLVDEELAPEVGVAGLSLQEALDVSYQTIDECLRFHTAIVTQYHVDYFSWGGVNPWVLGTTDYALSKSALPLTAAEWLSFVKARSSTQISNFGWSGNTLTFDVVAGGSSQTLLLPADSSGSAFTAVLRDGVSLNYSLLTVDGRNMVAVPAATGSYEVTYQADTTAPVITNVSAVPGTNSASITWTTDEPATSQVNYGLDQNLGEQAFVASYDTNHNVPLSNLNANTTYYYQVTSADSSANSSSSDVLTFTTLAPGAPLVQAISPTSSAVGQATQVTITGENFVAGASATLGAHNLLNVIVASTTRIDATVPDSIPAGTYDLTVINPDGQSSTLPNAYVVLAAPPQLLSVSPSVVTAGEEITVSGEGFASGATVEIGAVAAESVTVHNAGQATATVPADMAEGLYALTITNPDGQSDTLVDALTVSPLPTVGHTTVQDFTPGVLTNAAIVSGGGAGDGAVALASLGWLETFQDVNLDPNRWEIGYWQPDGSISLTTGALSISGAWVRSLDAIAGGRVTIRTTFNSQDWLNIGLSRTDALDNPWFLFGVPGWDTSRVYARYNGGGASGDIPLDGLIGGVHDYTLEYVSGAVRFLVDGVLVHEQPTTVTTPLAIWLSVGPSTSQLTVNRVELASFTSAGVYLSPALDAGVNASWAQLLLDTSTPSGTNVTASARSSDDAVNWSAWSSATSVFPIDLSVPVGRYLQYELNLTSTSPASSPLVLSVNGSYQQAAGPTVASVVISPTSVSLEQGASQQFSATAYDGNGDPIPDAPFTWSVVNGGGTINGNGLFIAGQVAGDYPDTIVVTSGSVTDTASVTVTAPPPPEVVGISPSIAAPSESVDIVGANFDPDAVLTLDANLVSGATVVSASQIVFTVPALPDAVYDVTVTNPDGQFITVIDGLTIQSLPTVGHTTQADFASGVFSQTESISGGNAGDGAVALLNAGFSDDFAGTTLDDSRWASGTWQTDGSLTLANGALEISGAWAHGQQTMADGAVNMTATFTSTPWQNIGLSREDSIDNPWFLFGVPGWDTSRVYVRYNFGSTANNIPLEGLIGSVHTYRIEYLDGLVRFLVDGSPVHEVVTASTGGLAAWLSVGSTGTPLVVDRFVQESFQSSGTFVSAALDAGALVEWAQLIVSAVVPSTGSLSARARSSTDGSVWSSWSPLHTTFPTDLTLPDGRYIQYELNLGATRADQTPLVDAVAASYRSSSGQTVTTIVVEPAQATLYVGADQQFAASTYDQNGLPIVDASPQWSVANGGGTIDAAGLFTAGTVVGEFANTVVASLDGVSGVASVTVEAVPGPEISSITPDVAAPGDEVVVVGQYFDGNATLVVGPDDVPAIVSADGASLTFLAPDLPDGSYDVTVVNIDGQSATRVNGLTISRLRIPFSIDESSAEDFGAGTRIDTEVSTEHGGEIRLALAGLRDDFDGNALDSGNWSTGQYTANGSVVVSGGSAEVRGAWIESRFTLEEGAISLALTFNPNGSPFLNVGFGKQNNLDVPWFLVGIPSFDTSQVYARTNTGSYYRDSGIAGAETGVRHIFTVRRLPDRIVYLLDNEEKVSHVVSHPANTRRLSVWISAASEGQSLVADWFRVDDYPLSGTYRSGVLDAGSEAIWSSVIGDVANPTGTSVSFRVRTSPDGVAWSDWSAPLDLDSSEQGLNVPDGRYAQYEVLLSGDGIFSPELRSITLSGEVKS